MSTIGTQLDAALSAVGATGPQGPVGPPGVPDPTLDARLTALENTVRGIVGLQIIQDAFAGNATQPSVATQLVITQQPTNLNSGAAFSPVVTVEVRDAGNVKVSNDTSPINCQVSVGDGSWKMTKNYHVNAVAGVATFTGMTLGGLTGNYTLTFTSTGLTTATSNVVVVTQVATALQIGTQPNGAVTPNPFTVQPTVNIVCGAGVPMTVGSQVVTVTKLSGPSTLSGTLTATAVNAVASFTNLAFTTPGTDVLQFTAPSLTLVNSDPVDVTAGGSNPAPSFPNIDNLGLTLWHDNNFTAGVTAQTGSPGAWNNPAFPEAQGPYDNFITDASSPTDTTAVYEVTWPGPVPGPAAMEGTNANKEYVVRMPASAPGGLDWFASEVHVGYIFKFQPDYQWDPSGIQKMVYLHNGGEGAGSGKSQFMWDEVQNTASPGTSVFTNQASGGATNLYATGTPVNFVTGTWYRRELRWKPGQPLGAATGVLQAWVSTWSGSAWSAAVQTHNLSNVVTAYMSNLYEVTITSLWGGFGSPVPSTFHIRYKHFRVRVYPTGF